MRKVEGCCASGDGNGGAGEKSGTTREHARPPWFRGKHEASQRGRGMFLAVYPPTMAAPNTLTATQLAHK